LKIVEHPIRDVTLGKKALRHNLSHAVGMRPIGGCIRHAKTNAIILPKRIFFCPIFLLFDNFV